MKEVFTKPMMHFIRVSGDVDVRELTEYPSEALAEVLRAAKAEEERKVYQANPSIISRQIGDEWVLIPTGSFAQHFNGMISLNEFSNFIWQQLQEPRSLGEVLKAAKAEFTDEHHTQDMEIREFITANARIGIFKEV